MFVENGQMQPLVWSPQLRSTFAPIPAHEAGHAEVALHFGVRILGVALEFDTTGMRPKTIYDLSISYDMTEADNCLLLAAGSAGEELLHGSYEPDSANRTNTRSSAWRSSTLAFAGEKSV